MSLPDLDHPFPNHAERAAARERLARRDATLQLIEVLATKPGPEWSLAERAAFPNMTNGAEDPAPQRTQRWASLFAEELAEVHQLAARGSLSDVELREGLFLAGRLLSTVTDWAIDMVDDFRVP